MDRVSTRASAVPASIGARFDDLCTVDADGDTHVRIGLNRLPGIKPPTVKVRASTIVNLHIAEQVIWDVRAYMPFMGNQISDIVQTKGEAWARMMYSRGHGNFSEALHSPIGFKNNIEFVALRATVAGGGCCEEAAAIAYQLLASRGLSEPISMFCANATGPVLIPERMHMYVTIGDPRERSDVAVVDPWPVYPMACTDQHLKFPYLWPVAQHPPKTPIYWRRQAIPTVPIAQINRYLLGRDRPAVGDELLAYLLLMQTGRSGTNPGYRDQLLTTSEPDAIYCSNDEPCQGMCFNRIPIAYWNRKQIGVTQTEQKRQEFKNFFRLFID